MTFYIFNRKGRCQYYHEWQRLKPVRQGAGSQEEDFKLMFGLCWSMRALATAIDPKSPSMKQMGAPMRIGDGCSFNSIKTSSFKLQFLESPSGLKASWRMPGSGGQPCWGAGCFVLTTDPSVGSMVEQLQYIYASLFVELVVKNPLYTPGEPFLFEPFSAALNKYMRALGLLS
ncbi:hypothetical protein CHLNCDRAFT_26165 [Chlorella variabilis]|uniref:Trafficking protein particle complex subunit n=1 Tax=Chlorella variabilis TaxID=554065 RepID=E1ZM57_CHLVA|nr:hypothetical protein CHLNCDRAFT_26165 [Chlorella variabilis]EFN53054.1 hypothetical protein CHLNCDRAFT_26165 [Chlorella variabilis]|eukprot:XP_005845156.1 hypothetical protein CHLNCDRAFT_26165 [Chlorella variabilis]